MYLQQLSIFVANRSGRLAEIADIIGDAGIDIRAISVADTTDFGILRLIVDQPEKARDVLEKAGVTVALTDVIAVRIEDKPGAFAGVLRILSIAGLSVEYMYAFISRDEDQAFVILRVDDNDKALKALTDKGISILDPQTIYSM